MKKIYIVLSAIVLVWGCDDFLELEPATNYTALQFFRNEFEVDRAVTGIYARNRGIMANQQWLWGEMRSDNTSFQFNPADRGGQRVEALDEFLLNADDGSISNYWNDLYDGVARTNYVLENIDNVSYSSNLLKAQRKGETRFFRAWFYFNLVRSYGDVPLVTNTVVTPEGALDAEYTQRVDAGVVYDTIMQNIDYAISVLPQRWPTSETGRITQGAALMLKAKVLMEQQQYAQAIPPLEQLTMLGYELMDDYEQVFNPDNKNNSESIFELQYDFDLGQASDFLSRFVPYNSGSDLLGGLATANSRAGVNQPTQDLIDAYEPGDIRKDVSISVYVKNNESIPYMGKFEYPFLDQGKQNVNFPVFRYADALLMLAECYTRVNGLDQNAIGYVNLIRLRAGLPPLLDTSSDPDLVVSTQEELLDAIAQERRVELAFENHRWFDLVRTGRAVEVMTAHGIEQKQEKTTVLPEAYTNIRTILAIPAQQVIQFGYEQNPGW
jgi:hypothetical protein